MFLPDNRFRAKGGASEINSEDHKKKVIFFYKNKKIL
jgi:hypothetical protein